MTFVTIGRQLIPEAARTLVLEHVLVEHRWRAFIHVAVVMPDHAHVLLTPYAPYALGDITRGVKGSSARSVNGLLGRTGSMWQHESLDHELRHDESLRQKSHYICMNPVRKRLCSLPDEYRWLWREWIEGRRTT